MITGNVIGGVLKTPDTFILVDDDGNEYTAAVTGEETELDATVDDVRIGKTVALQGGVATGEKLIPSYYSIEGYQIIPNGSAYKLTGLKNYNIYDFTKLQAIICSVNTTIDDSVAAHKVSLGGKVYDVNSTTSLATVSKNSTDKTVDFGLTNNTGLPQIIKFLTFKEN